MSTNAETIARAKVPLFKLFLYAGIDTVTVEFEGSGDEGHIEACEFKDRDGSIANIDHCTLSFNGGEEGNVTEYVEKLCEAILEETGLDWYNNAGGQGTITMSPLEDAIHVEMEINFHDYEQFEFEF